jgi:ABC-2 type transport system ATP-binding protein
MAVKRLINRVSVDAAFFKKLSPMENLLFAARLYGLDGRTAKRTRSRSWPAGHRGEARRPARRADEPGHAAEGRHRASPADEPDAPAARRADDRPRPASKLDVQTFIEELRETHDATIVLTTHDLAEASACAAGSRSSTTAGRRRGHPDGPQALIRDAGRTATLEDVFMTYTGRSLDDDVEEDEADDELMRKEVRST